MKCHHYSLVLLSLLALPLFAGPIEYLSKQPVEAPIDTQPLYLGTFNTGVKTSDVYTEGNLSFVIPVWSTLGVDGILGGGAVFLEPYTSLGEGGELATSLGIGWRYLFNDQPINALKSNAPAAFLTEGFYVGANVFVDNLRTQFDNDFWQLGIGAEIGTRYVEVRGNYYLPLNSGQKLAERNTSTQKFTSQSRSSSTRMENSATPLNDPFATGHTIQQDANLTTTAVTTTRTTTTKTTVKTITSLFEEGMEGWDLEAAFLIRGLDQYLDVTLLAGYYSFDNQPFGPQRGGTGNTEGFKAGIEIRPVPALVLTGMWYEDETFTGSDWVAGIGLQIPLGKEWKDAFKPRRRHLIERLAEPVARQNAAIKTARDYDVDQQASHKTSTQTAVRRRIVSQSAQRIVIKEDIVFVNNNDAAVGNGIEAGSATGDGTAERPVDTIQRGADIAGDKSVENQNLWNVYTQHSPTPYAEAVTISASTYFISSKTPIASPLGGAAFGGNTPRPIVNGGFAASSETFLPGSISTHIVSINGYETNGSYQSAASLSGNIPGGIADGDGRGIHLNNIDYVVLEDNHVTAADEEGIYIANENGLISFIKDNTSNNNGEQGIMVDVEEIFYGEITGNTTSNNGSTGLYFKASNFFGIGNIGDLSPGTISHNTAINNDDGGIHIEILSNGNGETGFYTGDFTHNTANDNRGGAPGILFVVDFFYGTTGGTGAFRGNTALDNDGEGILVSSEFGFLGDFTNNRAERNSRDGMVFHAGVFLGGFGQGSIPPGSFSNNTSLENKGAGIRVEAEQFYGDFTHNVAERNIGLDAVGISFTAGYFQGGPNGFSYNTANNNIGGAAGIRVIVDGTGSSQTQDSGLFIGDFTHNTANNNDGHGIQFTADAFAGGNLFAGDVTPASFSHNTANDNSGDGILLDLYGNGEFAFSGMFFGDFIHNTTLDNGRGGISISLQSSDVSPFGSLFIGNITNNRAEDNRGGHGMIFEADNFIGLDSFNSIAAGNISQNIANHNAGDGINVQVNSTRGNFIGNFTSNIANDNGDTGIVFEARNFAGAAEFAVELGDVFIQPSGPGLFTGNTANGNEDGYVIELHNFNGVFTGNTANVNDLNGFFTDVNFVLGGPFSPNTATGNGGVQFLNLVAPLANP